MDYSKMMNIKRESNASDNAFAMPPNKKITDTDDGGGSYYGNDIGVEIEDDYSYMIEDESEDTVKSVKLSKELLSYFLNEIKNIAVSLLEPYHTHTFTVSVTDDFKESINRMGVIEPLLIAQSANYGTVARSNELIPEGTEKLEERCFSDRKNISDVVIPGSIREIPYMAFASSSVKTAVIEPGVESISSCAFAATDLESISIPNTVKHIGEQAFAMTDITSIEIPASVKAIGYLAFNGCRNLKEVTMSKGTIFDKDTFPEGVNIRYRENEQEQSEPEEEEGFEPEI